MRITKDMASRAALGLCSALMAAATAASFPVSNPDYQSGFPVILDGTRVHDSSITLGDVDGDDLVDIVVSTWDGQVHAIGSDGTPLWSVDTGDMAIESKAAIGDLDGDGHAEVVVGAGSTFTPNSHGGLYVIDYQGSISCTFQTDPDASGWRWGVFSSPAVADLDGDGDLEIAFGAWDRYVRVINHDCSLVWEDYVLDTVWSSPAIGDVNGDGVPDVVIGVDSDSDPTWANNEDGGILHAYDGLTGIDLPGFPIQIDEVIWSSPGLGDIDGDGHLEIVVGTGYCWSNPDCAPGGRVHPGVGRYLNAWNHDGSAVDGWPVSLSGTFAFASPALANLDADRALEVIVNTMHPDDLEGGWVYALKGDGSALPGWPVQPTTPTSGTTVGHYSTYASPVTADLTGDGIPEVILPSNHEMVVWNSQGIQLTREGPPVPADAFQLLSEYAARSSAGVGDLDGDGDLEVVMGSAISGGTAGAVYVWDFDSPAQQWPDWPMFRRSSDSNAVIDTSFLFADGFERGNSSAWTATVQ